jgi:hypothetical protein
MIEGVPRWLRAIEHEYRRLQASVRFLTRRTITLEERLRELGVDPSEIHAPPLDDFDDD